PPPRHFADPPPDPLGDLRHNGISERGKAVHPIGNPISHSTHIGLSRPGVGQPATAAFHWTAPDSVSRALVLPGGEAHHFLASLVVGVGQLSSASALSAARPSSLPLGPGRRR